MFIQQEYAIFINGIFYIMNKFLSQANIQAIGAIAIIAELKVQLSKDCYI